MFEATDDDNRADDSAERVIPQLTTLPAAGHHAMDPSPVVTSRRISPEVSWNSPEALSRASPGRARTSCSLLGDVSGYWESSDDRCDEVRAVFYFALPQSKQRPAHMVGLPQIARSRCNVAIVDSTSRFRGTAPHEPDWAGGWRLRRLARWPFPGDAPRTAHYLKVMAPMLFPRARVVLAGDAKCQGLFGGFPCALMRPAPLVHLDVAKNRWFRSRSVEGEFVSTWKHMRARRMGATTFDEITAQLDAYDLEGYDLDALYRLPDTFCMAWNAQTDAARQLACQLGEEVAMRSMREQLAFDHARPHSINISWWAMRVINQHGSADCVLNASAVPPSLTMALPATSLPFITAASSHQQPVSSLPPAELARVARLDATATPTAPRSVRRSVRHAVCVTGLTRSFPENGASISRRMARFLSSTAPNGDVHIAKFGVRPRNDSWVSVVEYLGPFNRLVEQTPCLAPDTPLPSFFTCQRGRSVHRLDSCTGSFVQMQCDLARCDAMVGQYESEEADPVDYVTWMRLDVVWEMDLTPSLPLPQVRGVSANVVWLPLMNSQQAGLCDKFAFGTRRAMHSYLNRLDLIHLNYSAIPRNRQGQAATWSCTTIGTKQICIPKPFVDVAAQCPKRAGCMVSMSSERFLSFALYRANLTVVRTKWAFCKFGDTPHSWKSCTARLRAGTECRSLNCPSWMAGGCSCQNTTCSAKDWYCIQG